MKAGDCEKKEADPLKGAASFRGTASVRAMQPFYGSLRVGQEEDLAALVGFVYKVAQRLAK